MTAFIKGWVVAPLCAWQSWQWVTPFRRGFALCSIISHYYMSHLLPRIPMGEEREKCTHTRIGDDTQHAAHSTHQPPKLSNTLWRPAKRAPSHDNLHPPPQLGSYSRGKITWTTLMKQHATQQSRKVWEPGEILFIHCDITKLWDMSQGLPRAMSYSKGLWE